MKRWDEKLADLSEDLAKLSEKTADASADAKAAREMRQEVVKDRISTAKGNVVALEEKIRLSGEETKGKLGGAVLAAKMAIREKHRQRKEKRDKKLLEAYIDDQIGLVYESFEAASYLISEAQLAMLQAVEAIDEYNEKYGDGAEDAEDVSEEAEDAEEAEEAEETEEAEGSEEAEEAEE